MKACWNLEYSKSFVIFLSSTKRTRIENVIVSLSLKLCKSLKEPSIHTYKNSINKTQDKKQVNKSWQGYQNYRRAWVSLRKVEKDDKSSQLRLGHRGIVIVNAVNAPGGWLYGQHRQARRGGPTSSVSGG